LVKGTKISSPRLGNPGRERDGGEDKKFFFIPLLTPKDNFVTYGARREK